MCKEQIGKRQRIVTAGCGFLAPGVAMLTLSGHFGGAAAVWIHGVAGLLLGLSIGLNLMALRFGRCTLDLGSKR